MLSLILILQTITHLAWLSVSGQVGQLTIPYLMSQGLPLYTTLAENRPPADAALIALLFRLLPSVEPVLLVRALNLALILAITLLVYALARRLSPHRFAGLAAALVWFIWEPTYANLLAYFDTWVGLLFALAVLAWLALERSPRTWIAPLVCGVLLGLATLFKQPAWAGVILFGGWLVIGARSTHPIRVSLPAFVIGVLIPVGAAFGLFALAGGLSDYIFWNFERYVGGIPNGQPFTGEFFRKLLLTNIVAPAFVLLALQKPDRRWWLVIVLWFAGGATLFPNFGEIYVLGHLPLLAVMSGIGLAAAVDALDLPALRRPRAWLETADAGRLALVGLGIAIALGWGWTAGAIYAPSPLGRAKIPAHDEFIPVAEHLAPQVAPDDTLYVLPMGDGSAQLHLLLDLLPPGMWSTSHNVFLDVPGFTERLLSEWNANPPDWIVAFPEQYAQYQPGIAPLIDFLEAHYTMIDQVEAVPFNGDAVIYRLSPPA